ncbi:ComEC/Rec2 family competence protein [Nocardia sp. NPDC050718]|uniref:ComEC/Rec2 family competence protein n=1 Tax=Nocardia sp. NPDC050718 TaxID=3155788 RepID=UPI00341036D6
MSAAAQEETAEETERQVLDMRLVPAALGCWAATIVAVSLGWFAGLVLAVAAVVMAISSWVVLLWAIAHKRERWRVVAVAGLATMLATAGFGAAGAWRAHHVQTHPLRESFGRTVTVLAVVTDDPKPMRAGGFGGQRRWIVHAELREFTRGTSASAANASTMSVPPPSVPPVDAPPARVPTASAMTTRFGGLGGSTLTRVGGALVILAPGKEWAELSPGQAIRFRAKVAEPNRLDLTVAALHPVGVVERVGIPPWWQRIAAGVRADLAAASARALPSDAAGLLPALVVGDTVALSDEVRDAFEIAGLQHLCVVSGANFTILLTALLALTRLLTAGPRTSAAAGAVTVVMFVVLARPDPSVLRAAAMGSVMVLALVTGRRKQALPALGAAVIGLLGVAPQLAVSAGFALSVLATAGLILLAPSWADWLRARGWWRAPAEIVAVSAGAFVVTLPLMVALSGRVSVVAIVANALVAPVVGVITVIGAVGAGLACLWGDAAVWVLWCARPPMWWLLTVADRIAAVPGATVSVPSGMSGGLVAAAIVVVLVAALRWSKARRLLAVGTLGIAVVLVPVRLWQPGWPPAGWVLAMCDVGQGDGLALSVAPGAAIVIDTGPDPRPIRRCLDRLHITHVPLLILTHPHADHIDGLAGVLRGRTIAAIATAPGELRSASHGHVTSDGSSASGSSADGRRSVGAGPSVGSGSSGGDGGSVDDGSSVDAGPAIGRGRSSGGGPSVGGGRSVDDGPSSGDGPSAGGGPSGGGGPSAGGEPTGGDGSTAGDEPSTRGGSSTNGGSPATDGRHPNGEHSPTPPLTAEPGIVAQRHSSAHSTESGGIERVVELAESARIPLMELHRGHVLTFGTVELTVLAPDQDVPSSLDLDDANDRSLVLRARTAVGTILFTGDIEATAQSRVSRDHDIRADILKVPHHGSRTTTPEFLRAVHPRLALISAGTDNSFGHPHATIIAALDTLAVVVARTDRHGDVIVSGTAADPRIATSRRRTRARTDRHGPRCLRGDMASGAGRRHRGHWGFSGGRPGRARPPPASREWRTDEGPRPVRCRCPNVGSPGERTPCRGTSGSR